MTHSLYDNFDQSITNKHTLVFKRTKTSQYKN